MFCLLHLSLNYVFLEMQALTFLAIGNDVLNIFPGKWQKSVFPGVLSWGKKKKALTTLWKGTFLDALGDFSSTNSQHLSLTQRRGEEKAFCLRIIVRYKKAIVPSLLSYLGGGSAQYKLSMAPACEATQRMTLNHKGSFVAFPCSLLPPIGPAVTCGGCSHRCPCRGLLPAVAGVTHAEASRGWPYVIAGRLL